MAFDRGEPAKRYLALVRGTPPAERRVELALAPARRGRMRPARPGDPRGKPSATRLRLLEAFPPRPWAGGALALVEALPETGRTHQIRVHLAAEGIPLAVDPDYGDDVPLRGPDGAILIARTPLHAARLELRHPADGHAVVIEAPLAADLARAIEALRAG
jgi:tRNA pseudouridine32 synthase/23S rRNA pseudouridine746 synthase